MTKLKRCLARFKRAKRGIAAVEFALLAPVMILLLLGSVEVIHMFDTSSRVQNSAASLADLVARDTEVSDSEISGLWDALDLLMYPQSATTMRMRLTSIQIDASSVARVVWSEGRNISAYSNGSTISLPAGIGQPGTSVIWAEAEIDYESPLHVLIPGQITMRRSTYRRSRLVDPIPRV